MKKIIGCLFIILALCFCLAACDVTVNVNINAISYDGEKTIELEVGDDRTLSFTVSSADGYGISELKFVSSDESVVTAEPASKLGDQISYSIVGVGVGECKVYLQTTDGSVKCKEITVIVKPVDEPSQPNDDPPVDDPVVTDPPVDDPAVTHPPVDDPAVTDPPVDDPVDSDHPVDDPVDPDNPVDDPVDPDHPVDDPADPDNPVDDPVDPDHPVDEPCTEHVDENKDLKCDLCGEELPCPGHTDADDDLKCDLCGEKLPCPGHTDEDKDLKCDICGEKLPCTEHVDENKDLKCDLCGEELPCTSHEDKDRDLICDICGEKLPCPGHTDADDDLKCDLCGEELPCTEHVDKNNDKKCDKCGETYVVEIEYEVPALTRPSTTAADIPDYSGSTYIILNNNIPYFYDNQLTTESYEYYGNFDKYGRVTIAVASIGYDLMPTEDRTGQSYKPTGWEQNKYSFVNGGWLYNRCHLIGFQLTGENDNKLNLVTGTRTLNVGRSGDKNGYGMLQYENMVTDYIKSHKTNHVLYRVVPIFDGSNLLCKGVTMEAYSIEDNGRGICFNVFIYNVEDGVIIDYATGKNMEDPNRTKTAMADVDFIEKKTLLLSIVVILPVKTI